jgi:hypothetical protein
VAFCNRRDRYHQWAKDIASRVTEPLITCEAVLAETAYHLKSSAIVIALVETRLVQLDFLMDNHLGRMGALAASYSDLRPDLADLCLIVMSEQPDNEKLPVITIDRDFLIYRRHRDQPLPVLMPDDL